jgi:hypothetical protein
MKFTKRILPIVQLLVCFLALAGIVAAQAQTSRAENANSDLVGRLTKQLGVTPEQAKGGAGAIFSLAKNRLSPDDFSKLADAVPGMDGFLKAAPRGGAGLDSLGSRASGKGGGLASLAGSFQSLGLSPSDAGKFVPVLQKYIGNRGGSGLASRFAGAVK